MINFGKYKASKVAPPNGCKQISPKHSTASVSFRPLTFAGGVEQRGLEGHHLHVHQVLLNGHLHSEARVRVHVGQGQQVRGTHKEVPMEGVDGQTWERERGGK